MKIRLIQPAQLDDSGTPKKYRQIFLPSGTLANVAALTPPDVDVLVTDEYVDPVDFDENVDLVGITALTCQAPRAYQIADEFRKRGRTVVMGGIHATALPEEALEHVNSVVAGEAEDIWEQVVRDFQAGKMLAPVYKSEQPPDLSKAVIPRFELTNWEKCIRSLSAKTPAIPIFTSRGCPFGCSYCSVTRFFGGKHRTKPVEHVLREIEASRSKDFFFVDDNIMSNPEYAERLFREIAPLKIRWFSQFSTLVLNTPRLVELAGESGCHEVILGMESINPDSLAYVKKGFNKVERYKEVLHLLKTNGISPNVMLIFGFDQDTASGFARTIDFFLQTDANFIRINILTPFPGTDLHRQLRKDGRITETDWSRYDVNHVVFRPATLTGEDLLQGARNGHARFYSTPHIFRRLWNYGALYATTRRDSFFDDILFQLHFRNSTKKGLDPYSGIP